MVKRILLIDDDPVIREIVPAMLKSVGYEVIIAEDGPKGLAVARAQSAPGSISAILLDRQMPGMNGIEVLKKLKEDEHTSEIPVVLLTAEGQADQIMLGYSSGADYYIPKPFNKQQLLYGIQMVLPVG